MIKISEGKDNRRLIIQIRKVTDQTKVGIRKAYFQIGKRIKSYSNAQMQAFDKTGRVYRHTTVSKHGTFRKVTYTASAPGQFPVSAAPRTSGQTRASLAFLVKGAEQLEFGASTPWAKYLELGSNLSGKGGGKMEPRPFLSQSAKKWSGEAVQYFNNEIKKALTKK